MVDGWRCRDARKWACKYSALRHVIFWGISILARRQVRLLRAKLAAAKSKAPLIGIQKNHEDLVGVPFVFCSGGSRG